MKYFKTTLLTLIAALSMGSLLAQEVNQDDEQLSLNNGTIDNQFEYVITKSNNYQDYKVIKKKWLYTLKAHTLDSLKALQTKLSETQNSVDSQTLEINELKASLSTTKSTLDQTNLEKDSMSLFGLPMSKISYNTLMWAIIAGLLVCLLFFIYKFKNSNAVTKKAKQALEETEAEFEEHRRIALEREQKVRRQLQDEINKQKK